MLDTNAPLDRNFASELLDGARHLVTVRSALRPDQMEMAEAIVVIASQWLRVRDQRNVTPSKDGARLGAAKEKTR